MDHLKRTLCELLPDDRQLPNVPVTGAIIEGKDKKRREKISNIQAMVFRSVMESKPAI